MKKFVPLLFAASLISPTAFAASGSAFNGFYAGCNVGASFMKSVPLSGSVSSGTYNANLTTKTGVAVTGTVGYDFGSVRVAEEVGYQQNSIGGTATTTTTGQQGSYQYPDSGGSTSSTQPVSGNISVVSVMTSVSKDFQVGGVSPYVTAGAGVANVSFNNVSDGTTIINQHNTKLAYQIGAGVSYSFTPSVKMDIHYDYSAVAGFVSPVNTTQNTIHISSHKINVGMGYRF
jgi:OmpA-OmpF porin, OOP family